MSASVLSFIVWAGFMVVMLIGLIIASKKSKGLTQETEDVASRVLPELGRVAEKAHSQRFGSAPMVTPNAPRKVGASWYPPTKKSAAKHG